MSDYFAFMGFPRELTLDEGKLQQKYYELSRQYHPDFHTQGDEQARQQSLEQSSILNQAYRTLRDPYERARYLLDLEWPDLPDAEKKRIPPTLLMEVMEMQEKVAEAQFADDPAVKQKLNDELLDIEARLKAKMEGLREGLDRIAATWGALPSDAAAETRRLPLAELNTLLNTRNYIRTLLATIDAAIRGGEGVRH